jgi:hypothetical protein
MLSQEEKEQIISEFPKIKLSYETIIHKKVNFYDYIIGIPEGKTCFAWFTYFNDKSVCILLEMDKSRNNIKDIKIVNCCFSSSLCYGTIFYGTLFYHMNNPLFSIEDIFMYKGKYMYKTDYNTKLDKICYIISNEIKQVAYNNNIVVFGLPPISTGYQDFNHKLDKIKYKLTAVRYIHLNRSNSFLTIPFETYNSVTLESTNQVDNKTSDAITNNKTINNKTINNNTKITNKSCKNETDDVKNSERNINIRNEKSDIVTTIVFVIKPDIQNDIYHLYCLNDDYYGIACIPDYKTSVMMNNLFRNIKENHDLDKLEESDDEEEFENSNVDKFVFLDKSFKMECKYNNKFKKWTPIKLVDNSYIESKRSAVDFSIRYRTCYQKNSFHNNK